MSGVCVTDILLLRNLLQYIFLQYKCHSLFSITQWTFNQTSEFNKLCGFIFIKVLHWWWDDSKVNWLTQWPKRWITTTKETLLQYISGSHEGAQRYPTSKIGCLYYTNQREHQLTCCSPLQINHNSNLCLFVQF